MSTLFPVYYNDSDYWITTDGNIYDFATKRDITSKFTDKERAKLIAVAWIGDIDLPIRYRDGNPKNISRRNINYEIDEIIRIDEDHLTIAKETFYRVKEYKYYWVSKSGIIFSLFYKKFLHKKISGVDPFYTRISLVNANGNREMRQFHRIVWYTIAGIPENPDKEINHIDGRPWNNRYTNLEETTSLENIRHAMFVINHHSQTWTEHEIDYICKLLDSGITIADVYKIPWVFTRISFEGFKVLAHHLIKHTKFWIDISSKYSFERWSKSTRKYTDDQIRDICRYLEEHKTPSEIEKLTGIPLKYVSAVKCRISRPDISKQYNF